MTETLESASAAFLRAQAQLILAAESQWQPGMTPTPVEDTTERSKGRTGDPTSMIVDDTRRQKLRAAVLEVEAAQRNLLRVMTASANHLEKALASGSRGE